MRLPCLNPDSSFLSTVEATLPVLVKDQQLEPVQHNVTFEQASSASNIADEVALLKNQQLPEARPVGLTIQPNAAHEVNEHPLVRMLNQLGDSDFSQMERAVKQYFSNEPPLPPSVDQQQIVQNKAQELDTQINNLWKQHTASNEEVNRLKNHPFRAWNKDYESAINQADKTLQVISQSTAQKDLHLNQLKQWKNQGEVHRAWENAAPTVKMRELAETLKLPNMQERLNNIRQRQLSQAQEHQTSLNSNQQEQQQNQQHRRSGRGR